MNHTGLVLYIEEGQQESLDALELLKEQLGELDVVKIAERDEQTFTPWLATDESRYCGLRNIRYYLERRQRREAE